MFNPTVELPERYVPASLAEATVSIALNTRAGVINVADAGTPRERCVSGMIPETINSIEINFKEATQVSSEDLRHLELCVVDYVFESNEILNDLN